MIAASGEEDLYICAFDPASKSIRIESSNSTGDVADVLFRWYMLR